MCQNELVLDPQCFEDYNEFNAAERIYTFNDNGTTVRCDRNDAGNISPDWAGPGWYRFTGPAGVRMHDAAPGDYSCGTHAAGWLDDPHPSVDDGVVQGTMCFDWAPGDCWQTWEIDIVNCGDFYLYNLPDTIACSYRYCGTDVP